MKLKSLLAFFCLFLWSFPSFAEERITSFEVYMDVQADGRVHVLEKITIIAEGVDINRGIFRDIPTRYKASKGTNVSIGLDVLSVTMDGRDIPWRADSLGAGKRIRIGDPNRNISHGSHQFTIEYQTDRTLLFFDDRDELYWNVTGHGWSFSIDEVFAQVKLPDGVLAMDAIAYTGQQGATGSYYETSGAGGNSVFFLTTRALVNGEAMTIAVSWPAGYIDRPTMLDKTSNFFMDNAVILIGSIGSLIVFFYFLFVWNQFGRDDREKVIYPQYEPPDGIAPALCRHIAAMGYSESAISAAIVSMAQKGHLTIEQDGDIITLHSLSSDVGLSAAEKILSDHLFERHKTVTIGDEYNKKIERAIAAFKKALVQQEVKYFLRNRQSVFVGFILAIIATFLMLTFNAYIGIGAVLALGLLSYFILKTLVNVRAKGMHWSLKLKVMLAVFFIVASYGVNTTNLESPYLFLFTLLNVLICGVFFFLMKAPTEYGRAIMAHIDGFKLYLGVAEQDRMNFHNPPEKTPEVFEKYLPYAIALDLENEWGEQFDDVLKRAAALEGKESYYPVWYHGTLYHGAFSSRSFSSGIANSMSSAISTASIAPSTSSSGGFGGGSVGGGFGGGGGGGW